MTIAATTQNRKTRRTAGLGRNLPFIFFFGTILAALTMAQPTGPDSISVGTSERGNISNSAAQVNAQAGNVTNINIEATAITQAWQGYYGNITGQITLEDSSGNVFYNWSGLGSVTGEVYASRNDSVTWAGINCSNSTHVASENTFLGKQAADPDSVDNTFSATNHPLFQVGSTTITNNTCPSTNAYSEDGQDATNFYQVLLADTASNIVYTTLIDDDEVGFNSQAWDFELLVGENGNASEADTVTTYYFYIELS